MESYLYILYSAKLNRYYVGSTNNLARRLKEHAHKHTVTTRNGEFTLVFNQKFNNLESARKAELKLKKWKRRDIIERIVRDGKMTSIGD